MFSIDELSMSKTVDFVSSIKKTMQSDFTDKLNFEIVNFKAVNHRNTIAAIDGSHYSLKGGSFIFSAIRSGIHYFGNGKLEKEQIGQVKVEIFNKENFTRRHREYFESVTKEKPQGQVDFDKVTERIRTLLEWDKVDKLLNQLSRGDIILFDGSMISGVISTNKAFFNSICDRAKQRGIILVGFSKDTTITKNNVPVPKLLLSHVQKHNIQGNWFAYYEPEDTYFVKFRRHLDQIFRLDLVLPEDISAKDAISLIGSYCFDTAIPGYPYPLETIHNRVMISRMQFEKCLEMFKSTCMDNNIPLHFINDLFEIYHDQLDVNASGR